MSNQVDSRNFLKGSIMAVGTTLAGAAQRGRAESPIAQPADIETKPVETVRIGFVGVGSRGTQVERAQQLGNARRSLSMPAINKHLPGMQSRDGLIGNGGSDDPPFCFAKQGEMYVIYRDEGGDIDLDLANQYRDFYVKWYDPRQGGALQDGSLKKVTGGVKVSLGQATQDDGKSWAIVVSAQRHLRP